MLAYLSASITEGAELFARVRERPHRVTITTLPFVSKRYKR